MNSEKLIHIKFEYSSALESKRDILASEIDLLKISRRLKKYMQYRMEELTIKADMERKFRALKLDLGRLQNLLPPVKIPEILKEAKQKIKQVERQEKKVEEKPEKVVKEIESPEDDLDMQLQQIQSRLSSLKG